MHGGNLRHRRVQVVRAQAAERLIQSRFYISRPPSVVPELRRDEDILPRDAACGKCLADLVLVPIGGGAV
eukprot:scaffold71468_cov66-Phaeocystis_antarctica.AAC.3